MSKNDFWNLSCRPYTQLKLKILKEYLDFWARVFFSQASKNKDWKKYQDIYYIDCFAGRGKYHYNGQKDVINGSPLIALNCTSEFQKNPKYKGVKMHCVFVERYKKFLKIWKNSVSHIKEKLISKFIRRKVLIMLFKI